MAIAVAVTDRPDWHSCTDVIVVADPERGLLTWVPRDLWIESTDSRINVLCMRRDIETFTEVLRAEGFAIDGWLLLRRDAVSAVLDRSEVTMPVREPLDFWYPLEPEIEIEEGRKQISFRPPVERLAGERLHQWIGARYELGGSGDDRRRIARQQQLLAVMLGSGFDFTAFIASERAVRMSDASIPSRLAGIGPTVSMRTLGPLVERRIRGASVLVHSPSIAPTV